MWCGFDSRFSRNRKFSIYIKNMEVLLLKQSFIGYYVGFTALEYALFKKNIELLGFRTKLVVINNNSGANFIHCDISIIVFVYSYELQDFLLQYKKVIVMLEETTGLLYFGGILNNKVYTKANFHLQLLAINGKKNEVLLWQIMQNNVYLYFFLKYLWLCNKLVLHRIVKNKL
jgi:hypothetical protein